MDLKLRDALRNPKLYEHWRFADTNKTFEEWVRWVYAEYVKVKVDVYA